MAKSKPSAILYKNNKLEIHTEIHEKSVALNRDIVNFAIYSLIVTILTNVCNTKLITNFKVELVVSYLLHLKFLLDRSLHKKSKDQGKEEWQIRQLGNHI